MLHTTYTMNNTSSTQQFIDIAGIREGIIILKNGGYRLILSTSAVNFSLKSEQEQNSLVFQYQSFLNSLHFPIQIVIQSKKLDLNQYLKKLNTAKEKQKNELLRLQMEDYSEFVSQLINVANIMKKNFYVVVSYDPINISGGSIIDKIFKKNAPANIKISDVEFKRHKDELVERANVLASGLGSMGIRCVQLNTEEIIELFYKIYNPEMADKERFEDVESIDSSVVIDKREAGMVKSESKSPDKEEVLIDNGSLVEEQQKVKTDINNRENSKDAEKQIVKEGVANQNKAVPADRQEAESGMREKPQTPVNNPAPATTIQANNASVPATPSAVGQASAQSVDNLAHALNQIPPQSNPQPTVPAIPPTQN